MSPSVEFLTRFHELIKTRRGDGEKHTTVLIEIPSVAASSSLRLSGTLICTSPLATRYSANEPLSGCTGFLRTTVSVRTSQEEEEERKKKEEKYLEAEKGVKKREKRKYSRPMHPTRNAIALLEILRDAGADLLNGADVVAAGGAAGEAGVVVDVFPVRGVDGHGARAHQHVAVPELRGRDLL